MTYAQAGVSVDAGNALVEAIKPFVRATRRPGADGEIGGFGGVFDLAAAGFLFTAYYTYRIVQWKTEVGGWWNLALGKRPPRMAQMQGTMSGNSGGDILGGTAGGVPRAQTPEMDLEFHINAIASILDIRPTDLASVLSSAVHDYVPPKTLSSLSSSASAENAEKTAIEAFFGGDEEINEKKPGVTAKMGNLAKAVDAIIGFEEPIQAAE